MNRRTVIIFLLILCLCSCKQQQTYTVKTIEGKIPGIIEIDDALYDNLSNVPQLYVQFLNYSGTSNQALHFIIVNRDNFDTFSLKTIEIEYFDRKQIFNIKKKYNKELKKSVYYINDDSNKICYCGVVGADSSKVKLKFSKLFHKYNLKNNDGFPITMTTVYQIDEKVYEHKEFYTVYACEMPKSASDIIYWLFPGM